MGSKSVPKTKQKKNKEKPSLHTHTLSILLILKIIEIGIPMIWITLSDTQILYYNILRHTVFKNLLIILSEAYQLYTI